LAAYLNVDFLKGISALKRNANATGKCESEQVHWKKWDVLEVI